MPDCCSERVDRLVISPEEKTSLALMSQLSTLR